MTKTRLWLALTGWLPWACYFGIHHPKLVLSGRTMASIGPGVAVPYKGPEPPYMAPPYVFFVSGHVCRHCGIVW